MEIDTGSPLGEADTPSTPSASEAPPKKEAARAADAAGATLARSIAEQQLPNGLVKSIVLSYLLRHCYRDTALSFLKAHEQATANGSLVESTTEFVADAVAAAATTTDDIPSSTPTKHITLRDKLPADVFDRLDRRKRVIQLVEKGDILQAVDAADELLPKKGSTDAGGLCALFPSLFFRLSCQHYVELLRARRTADALTFAQQTLAPLGKQEAKSMTLLREYVALLAYSEPEKSPLGSLMSLQSRRQLAEELNDCIYNFDQPDAPDNPVDAERQSRLERLVRQLSVTMDKLQEVAGTGSPKWSLNEALRDKVNGGT